LQTRLSHHGVGLELRQASSDAFTQFSSILANAVSANDGSVCREGPIAEAFPNAFLGVLMPEVELLAAPKLKRGRRFDWLYKRIVKSDPKHLGEFCTCKIYRPNLTISLANPIE
jgi:hypothetical protein